MTRFFDITFSYGTPAGGGETKIHRHEILSDNNSPKDDIEDIMMNVLVVFSHMRVPAAVLPTIFADAFFQVFDEEDLEEEVGGDIVAQRDNMAKFIMDYKTQISTPEHKEHPISSNEENLEVFQKQIADNKEFAKKVMTIFLESME